MAVKPRILRALLCPVVVATVAWIGAASQESQRPAGWAEVAPGIWRADTPPYSYALVDGKAALLIDAAHKSEGLKRNGVEQIEVVLLTHHHRDTCAAVADFRAAGVPVRAAVNAADWLLPDQVRKLWQAAIPLRDSRFDTF